MKEKGNPVPTVPYKTVFVLGIARSGSTLLGRMLDMHSKVLCVGEMMRTGQTIEDGRTCSCGQTIEQCLFWREHLPFMRQASGLKYRKFTPALYRTIAEAAGKEIVFDLSKTLVWRAMMWPPNWRWIGRRDHGFLFLIRDSRGVTASSIRSGKDFEESIWIHFKWMKRFHRFMGRYMERTIVVRYEDLCAEPRTELERICRFMGITFEDSCLTPDQGEHHLVRCSKSGYLKNQQKIERDDRWKSELTTAQIARVEQEMKNIPFLKQAYL